MIIKGGNVFYDNTRFETRDIYINDGVFANSGNGECINAEGMFVIPGLIDMHLHGSVGADASEGEISQFEKMSDFLASKGVTGFCPTTMTLPIDVLKRAFCAADTFKKTQTHGSKLIGIHMEGPYFSMEKRGAQNPDYIKNPSIDEFKMLWDASNGIVAVADVAPELENAPEYIEYVSTLTTVSIAHTSANYESAKLALQKGATSATRLFNAMTPFTHRDPGVPGAVFESDSCYAELICDCIHIHPAIIKTVFKTMGDNRVCVISDALPCAGLPEGKYISGGLEVYLKDGCARLENGTLAGSASTLFDNFKKVCNIVGIDSAVKACSANPAKNLGIYDKVGSITLGKFADFLILDKDLNLKYVFINGKQVL